MKKTTWLVIGGVAGGLVVVWLAAGWMSPGTPVEVDTVRRDRIQEFVDERGITRLPRTYVITMPYNGRIAPITLAEGDPVKQGDSVAQIVPEDLKLAVDQAKATVERLDASIAENRDVNLEKIAWEQAELFDKSMEESVKVAASQKELSKQKYDYSDSHLQRVETLFKQKLNEGDDRRIVSKDEFERAALQAIEDKLAWEQSKNSHQAMVFMKRATETMLKLIEQYIEDRKLADAVLRKQKAEADVRRQQAELDQKRGTILSPVDGVVLRRCECNERALAAGTPLLEIGRLEDLEIEADVLSVDVVKAKQGSPVRIYGPAVGEGLPGDEQAPEGRDYAKGTVHKIYPAGFTKISSLGVEEQRVKVIIGFDKDDREWLRKERNLGVGYRVRVRIYTDENPNALVVPSSALSRDGEGNWNVYAVRDGRAQVQPVEVGMINDELAEVIQGKGLAEGDQVVRAPESDLADGQRVEAVLEKGP